MTSASELFYNRRSRLDRNTPLELGLDSPAVVDRISHHTHYHNRRQSHHNHPNRRDRTTDINIDNNCDPLRRSSNPARPIHRLSFPHAQERESVRVEQGTTQSASSNVINPENFRSIRNRESFSGNDRLPGAVLLARERLLERLRGVSSSRNRQRSRVSSGLNEDDFTFGVNNRIADPEEWDINSRTDWLLASEETRKRPPGLTKEALNSLHTVIFINQEEESVKMRASKECSICLDSFLAGEKLLCLPCGHRFHYCCLEPWIRTCGDCPNCRTGIVVSNYRPVK